MLLQAIKELSVHVKDLSSNLTLHREETAESFEQVNKRFEQIDERFEQIDKRFEQIDERFEQADEKFQTIDKHMHRMNEQIADLTAGQKLFVTEVWNNKKDLQRLKNTLGL